MRVSYRPHGHRTYWQRRWAHLPADAPMSNPDVYPLKYARLAAQDNPGPMLEAGCGRGRLLRYFHETGANIVGCDYIEVALAKLHAADPNLRLQIADVTRQPNRSGAFQTVLTFGLLHNLKLPAVQGGLSVNGDKYE